MITALQIALILILIALIGIILGYLLGKLSCKKRVNELYFDKNDYCENSYIAENDLLSNFNNDKPSILSDNNIATVADKDFNEESITLEGKNSANENSNSQSFLSSNQVDEKSKDIAQNNTKNKPEEVINENDTLTDNATSNVVENSNIDNEQNEEDNKPAVLSEPRDGKADNLCRIKGIGFVIEEKLHNLGVFHFDQIAAWSEDEIKWVDSHLAFSGRILREDWIGQAAKLAAGEDTEFSKRVDKGKVSTSRKTKENKK